MFTEDLAAFFDPAVFGTPAIYGAATIAGIFDRGFAAASVGAYAGVEGARITYQCREADVPGIARGSVLTIAGDNYKAKAIEPDGTGVVVVVLERA